MNLNILGKSTTCDPDTGLCLGCRLYSLSYLLNHRVLETGISFVAQHIPAHDDSFIRTYHMICRLNDPQKFHILQIYLFLSTGTTPWAATVNSACQASQGGGFFLQKEGDNHLFLVLRVSLKLGMGPCWFLFSVINLLK